MELLGTAGVLALFMAALFAAGRLLVVEKRRGMILYSLAGIASLCALHAMQVGIGINLFTLGVSALLGIPGTALVWVVSVII